MIVNRKEFLKKSCLSAICACSFASFIKAEENDSISIPENPNPLKENAFIKKWITCLLDNQEKSISSKELQKAIKKSSSVHYDDLQMDQFLEKFVGNMEAFINEIENVWGWKVIYNKEKGQIIANENKKHCVCPLFSNTSNNANLICNCSEGFAEKMFSKVYRKKVSAKVVSSVIRGNDSCVYEINLNS